MGTVVFYVKKNTIANGNMTQEEMFTDEVSYSSLMHITFSLICQLPSSFSDLLLDISTAGNQKKPSATISG